MIIDNGPGYLRIKIPDEWIMEKSKMTREEALERTGFIKGNKDTIAALEALGLLKFEERPTAVSHPMQGDYVQIRLRQFGKSRTEPVIQIRGELVEIISINAADMIVDTK